MFAVTAAGYYGIIDLVGKRGVILQHRNSTRRQKGPKMVGAVRGARVSHDARYSERQKDAVLLTARRIKKQKIAQWRRAVRM